MSNAKVIEVSVSDDDHTHLRNLYAVRFRGREHSSVSFETFVGQVLALGLDEVYRRVFGKEQGE